MNRMKTPDRTVLGIIVIMVAFSATWLGKQAGGPSEALEAIFHLPALPFLCASIISAPICFYLERLGISYAVVIGFLAAVGWVLLLALAAFSGYRGIKMTFYILLFVFIALLAISLLTSFAICT